MKQFHFTIFLSLIAFSILAQAPENFKIQFLVHDKYNKTLINQTIGIRISILKDTNTGGAVYIETQSLKTNDFGLITTNIGITNPLQFSQIKWSEDIYFTKIETDISGGTNYSISGTSQLLPVPFSEYAKSSDKAKEIDPFFQEWDKTTGIKIQENQIKDLTHFKNTDEIDPVYKTSSVAGINEIDLSKWNNHEESDPIFTGLPAKSINSIDTSKWNNKSYFKGLFNSLTNVPFYSLISFSGEYSDLINKPSHIVTVNNETKNNGIVQFDGTNWITIPNGKEGQLLSVNGSGQLEWKDAMKEDFDNIDRPFFEYNAAKDYYDCKPWNYNKSFNSEIKYPLVVYLHGGGGAGSISYLNYLGYDTNDGKDDQKAKEFQINHPSFVLVPQTTAGEWDGKKVVTLIEDYKKQYRIDTSRIYLIGYSMGGSGSYIVANDYFDYNKQIFAGIIRLAGQSQTEVRSEIAKKTAIWLHIGLDDTSLRISVTRDAYDFLKNIHADASETSKVITVSGYTGTILTLSKGNREIVKKTEYDNVGHGIATFPFNDSSLIEWLYNLRIED
jgi:hypothetical protein